jgi:uncharacterized protein (TIGR03435 family)
MRLTTRCAAVIAVVAAAAAVPLHAQAPPSFEAASIHPTPDGLPASPPGVQITPRQFRASYLSLRDYIGIAYGVRPHQIVAPEWVASARFDIVATFPEGGAPLPEALQALLAQRFGLTVHREPRDFEVYALEQAKDGVPPARVPDPEPGEAPFTVTSSTNGTAIAADLGNGASLVFANNRFEAKRVTMALLAETLGRFMDRPIVDRTQLEGRYDIVFDVAADDYFPMLIRSAVNAGITLPPEALHALDVPSSGSVPDALHKLGLSLDRRRAPLDVVVVDHIEHSPTAN